MDDIKEKRGEFYIEKDECLICGVCHHEAPGLIGWSTNANNSEITRQPATPAELGQIFDAIICCCADCFYYTGSNPEIVRQLDGLNFKGYRKGCCAGPEQK